MKKNLKEQNRKKILSPQEMEKVIASLRKEGKTIATLNGSFDLLHAGHLHMLFEASEQADVLIVALNTDESIKKYKSPKRPLIPLKERMMLIAAIECVDYVTFFDEVDPRNILSRLRPDVHVNGREYGENCIEAEVVKSLGGKIHLVDRVGSFSTSLIIEKLKQCV